MVEELLLLQNVLDHSRVERGCGGGKTVIQENVTREGKKYLFLLVL